MVAEVVGMSPRTLQRRVAEGGLIFSAVVGRARFGVATDLLAQTDATSLEIARATGYRDPSHFARTFNRLAEYSPRRYPAQAARFDESILPITEPYRHRRTRLRRSSRTIPANRPKLFRVVMGSILGIVEFFESEGWRKLTMDLTGDRVLITGASRG